MVLSKISAEKLMTGRQLFIFGLMISCEFKLSSKNHSLMISHFALYAIWPRKKNKSNVAQIIE